MATVLQRILFLYCPILLQLSCIITCLILTRQSSRTSRCRTTPTAAAAARHALKVCRRVPHLVARLIVHVAFVATGTFVVFHTCQADSVCCLGSLKMTRYIFESKVARNLNYCVVFGEGRRFKVALTLRGLRASTRDNRRDKKNSLRSRRNHLCC